ncbi:MAG: hypothetical protein N4A41_00430 [Crocinitomicaceae bacterium]|jgi:phage gpG-like protein|nr:hypothetical protein [Crocinitomicaceae bacterium]
MPADFKKIYRFINSLERYLKEDVYTVIGVEAVNHFQDSFHNQGFTDKGLRKWKDVKRRQPSSSWYGFQYKSKVRRPGTKQRKDGAITNFSPAATKRPILSGTTQELLNSIEFRSYPSQKRVVIFSDVEYAKIHNEGGPMRVFGKGNAIMPKRKFIGESQVLIRKIQRKVDRDINHIIKRNK